MSTIKAWKLISLFFLISLTVGCGSKEEQFKRTIQQSITQAQTELNSLGDALDAGSVRNAVLLKEYAKVIKEQQPDLTKVADLMALDATRKGALYTGLVERLKNLKKTADTPPYQETLKQLELLRDGLKPAIFNDALTDPLNMLADMSKGKLARVGAINKQQEGASEGNQLVGNPNYGSWHTNSNGISFWQWYGMYRMFGDVFNRVEYGSWSRHRGYSYYNDYGRSRYSSPSQIRAQNTIETRTKRSYRSQGKQFTSPYASTKKGASGLSRSSYTPPRSTRSNYSSRSSYNSTGSIRNSSSRTSRGISRGK